jgi:hypothetical protein
VGPDRIGNLADQERFSLNLVETLGINEELIS